MLGTPWVPPGPTVAAPEPPWEVTALAPLEKAVATRPAASDEAASRDCVAEPAGDRGAETFSDTEEPWPPMFGHPWKATNVLASTNKIAAPAYQGHRPILNRE